MKLNLLILRTTDIEQLQQFYAALLETTFTLHTDHGPRHYATQLKDITIEIYPTQQPLGQLDTPGFTVDDLEGILARMQTAIHKKPYTTPYGRSAMLKDPDGRLIYLTEQHA